MQSASRNKGTCENRLTIRRDVLEKSVLNGLRIQIPDPALFREFCDEFIRVALKSELPTIERELDKAILDGVPGSRLKDRIGQLETHTAEIEGRLAETLAPPLLLHPNNDPPVAPVPIVACRLRARPRSHVHAYVESA